MFEFIRIQYIMGKINADQVAAFSLKNYITAEQAKEIIALRQ